MDGKESNNGVVLSPSRNSSKAQSSSSTLNELLMSALELDTNNDSTTRGDLFDENNSKNALGCNVEDLYVQLNSIATSMQSVENLLYEFETSTSSAPLIQQSKSATSHIQILLTELQQCRNQFAVMLAAEMEQFAVYKYNLLVDKVFIDSYLKRTFNISGEEMDARSEEHILLMATKACIDSVIGDEDTSQPGTLLKLTLICISPSNIDYRCINHIVV